MDTILRNLTYQGIPIWRNVCVLRWVSQITSGLLVVLLVSWFFGNIGNAIEDREIPYGFSFLSREYQTPIGQHFLSYEASDTFLYAFFVALTNTLIVSIVGVTLATILGIFVGVCRMSSNWIVSKIALLYIEFFLNVPLLVPLFFWFYVVLELPPVREGYGIAQRMYINNGGLSIPWVSPNGTAVAGIWLLVVALAIVAGFVTHRRLASRERDTGIASYPLIFGVVVTLGISAFAWLLISFGLIGSGAEPPFTLSYPEPKGAFGRIAGGLTLSGGLIALLAGLVTYTAAFIAVRSGSEVSRTQQV